MNASMMLVTFLAILGIAAECVTLLLLKAHEMNPVLSTPKQIGDSVISGESDRNSCLVGSWKQDGPVERYTRFLEDNPACFPLLDENLADEGFISIAGIASPAFVMSIPQWNMVFDI